MLFGFLQFTTTSNRAIEPLYGLWQGVIGILPGIITAFFVLLLGILAGALFCRLTIKIVKLLQLDKAFKLVGIDELLSKADIKLDTGKFLGETVRWFIVIAFLIAAVDILGLNKVSDFLGDILFYIPNIIVAIIILIIGFIVAHYLAQAIEKSLKLGGYKNLSFLAGLARWIVIIFTSLAALSQLKIASNLIDILFTGLVAMIALAGGLAFGLGGREIAQDIIKQLKKDVKKH